MSRALITGVTGQDGSYLAELLISKDYEVWGIVRRSSSTNTWRLDHLLTPTAGVEALHLVYGDVLDVASLVDILRRVKPDEIYHLAAQSHVRVSFDVPTATSLVDAIGTQNVFEAARVADCGARIYQASSSEMFGRVSETPQTELTPFHPRSPYACAKAYAFFSAVNYREAYGTHISNGILFNHSSPRRGESFVEKKIVRAVAQIHRGQQKTLRLGNLDAKRDFGWAPEYVEAMWRILQQPQSDDYVIATGETHTIREIVEIAFDHVGLDWQKHVELDDDLLRPTEVDLLCGDASKAARVLDWRPHKRFTEIVTTMMEYELAHQDSHTAYDIMLRPAIPTPRARRESSQEPSHIHRPCVRVRQGSVKFR